MGIPTVNLHLEDVPSGLLEGIYACWVTMNGTKIMGALHYGPRPVFHDSVSCEVHLLHTELRDAPEELTIEPVGRLRDVRDFRSPEELRAQIEHDVADTRAMLGGNDPAS